MLSAEACDVQVGDTVKVELPYSEVCMYMRVAGQQRSVQVQTDGVQILNEDGTRFSFPITHGEAGLHRRDDGFYFYPPAN